MGNIPPIDSDIIKLAFSIRRGQCCQKHLRSSPIEKGFIPMTLVSHANNINKCMAKVCILDILENASEDRPLTQGMIREQLEELYGIEIDRKTVRGHLTELIESIDSIHYRKEERMVNNEASDKLTDFWLQRKDEFEENELQALIYGVIFNKHMPTKFKRDLVSKLESLSNNGLHRKLKNYLTEDPSAKKITNELFWNLDLLNEAIDKKRKVRFFYDDRFLDNDPKRAEPQYTVSPLAIGSHDNDHYLVGLLNGAEHVSPRETYEHFRLFLQAIEEKEVYVSIFRMDRIKSIEILNEERVHLDGAKKMNLKGSMGDTLQLLPYMGTNRHLKSGYNLHAKLLLFEDAKDTANELYDLFEKAVFEADKTSDQNGDSEQTYIASVFGNNMMIRDFALRNADRVELIEPTELRNELLDIFERASDRIRVS